MTLGPELYQWAATEGPGKYFGSVRVLPVEGSTTANVYFEHTLLGDFIDPMELENAVSLLYASADQLDDVIHEKFGGKRFTDT